MYSKAKHVALYAALIAAPSFVFAGGTNVSDLATILGFIQGFINTALPLVISLAVLTFTFGIFLYISSGDDAEARTKGRGVMVGAVLVLFVMVSLWGLVNLLENTFGLNDATQDAPNTPAYIGLQVVT